MPPRSDRLALAITLLAALAARGIASGVGSGPSVLVGCSRRSAAETEPDTRVATPAASTEAREGASGESSGVVFDPVAAVGDCTFGHHGVLLELGASPNAPRVLVRSAGKARGDTAADAETIERDGAQWLRVRGAQLALDFTLTPEDVGSDSEAPFVMARARGIGARSAAAYINGKPVGVLTFERGETKLAIARGGPALLVAGRNELLLRFSGRKPRGDTEPRAELDWLHVGVGTPPAAFAAPKAADVVATAAVHGVVKRAFSLRGPGYARCGALFPPGSQLEVWAGLAGEGEAEGEVRLLRDRAPAVSLGAVRLTSTKPGWVRVTAPLSSDGADVGPAVLEFLTKRASRGARLLFGEPKVMAPRAAARAAAPKPASGVVLVVLGSTARASLAPYGGARPVPTLAALAKRSVVFDAHRASSSFAAGALASILSGVTPNRHTVADSDAKLPASLLTLGEAARQGGVQTALFTANPTTGAAFGFERGWDTFVAALPPSEAPATDLLDQASAWIAKRQGKRFLAVVHARGGHPPWDVTADELKRLDPPGYGGAIDPRHAGELLSKLRKTPTRLTDDDRARTWALHAAAIDAHDAALGRLLDGLRASGLDGRTLVIVTSDVAASEFAQLPFTEGDLLDEAALAVPLIVSAPGGWLASARVASPTTPEDIAFTTLASLGLKPPATFTGASLFDIARGADPNRPRALLAFDAERVSLRVGSLVLAGGRDRKLCDHALDAACATDVRPTHPYSYELLERALARAIEGPAPPVREPAPIDEKTATALRLWGR
jgi:hypothetical protein